MLLLGIMQGGPARLLVWDEEQQVTLLASFYRDPESVLDVSCRYLDAPEVRMRFISGQTRVRVVVYIAVMVDGDVFVLVYLVKEIPLNVFRLSRVSY